MNHQKVYKSIIQKAQSENRIKLRKNNLDYIYYEKHHIIPKCLGGTNKKENLILLTAREHFICHKLLMLIHYNNRGIILAFIRMLYSKNFKEIFSSKDYKLAKEYLSNQMIGRTLSEEHKKNIAKGVKGKIKGIPKTREAKINMRKSRLKFLEENVKPLLGKKRPGFGEKQKGEKNPMFSKHHSKKSKKIIQTKMKKLMKGKVIGFKDIKCEYCGIITTSGNHARWHGNNCKFKMTN